MDTSELWKNLFIMNDRARPCPIKSHVDRCKTKQGVRGKLVTQLQDQWGPGLALHPQERCASAVLCKHQLKIHQRSEGVLGAIGKGNAIESRIAAL